MLLKYTAPVPYLDVVVLGEICCGPQQRRFLPHTTARSQHRRCRARQKVKAVGKSPWTPPPAHLYWQTCSMGLDGNFEMHSRPQKNLETLIHSLLPWLHGGEASFVDISFALWTLSDISSQLLSSDCGHYDESMLPKPDGIKADERERERENGRGGDRLWDNWVKVLEDFENVGISGFK